METTQERYMLFSTNSGSGPQKNSPVWQPPSHLTYQPNLDEHNRLATFVEIRQIHLRYSSTNSYPWTHRCWPNSKDSYIFSEWIGDAVLRVCQEQLTREREEERERERERKREKEKEIERKRKRERERERFKWHWAISTTWYMHIYILLGQREKKLTI